MLESTLTVADIVGPNGNPVVTVHPRDTIADSVDLLKEHGIGAVVVSRDDDAINGIISERDIVRHLAREQEGTLRLKVEDLMTSTVSTCGLDAPINDVMATMTRGRFRHMPVVNATGELCGIVSMGDLVKARLDELEAETIKLEQLVSTTS